MENVDRIRYDLEQDIQELDELDDEIRAFESDHANFENLDEYNDLTTQYYEIVNRVAYYRSCIESIEEGYE